LLCGYREDSRERVNRSRVVLPDGS
jgi:hypothetical protein